MSRVSNGSCPLCPIDDVDDRGNGRVFHGSIGCHPLLAMAIASLTDDDRRFIDETSSVRFVSSMEAFTVLLASMSMLPPDSSPVATRAPEAEVEPPAPLSVIRFTLLRSASAAASCAAPVIPIKAAAGIPAGKPNSEKVLAIAEAVDAMICAA